MSLVLCMYGAGFISRLINPYIISLMKTLKDFFFFYNNSHVPSAK